MRVYIAVSFSHLQQMQPVLSGIKTVLEQRGGKPFVFCEHYHFTPGQEQDMMRQALLEIDRCDLLMAECSHKAIGVGVEAGYAKGTGKPVIYLRHKDAPHSTTVAGVSDYLVIYEDAADLERQLQQVLAGLAAGR